MYHIFLAVSGYFVVLAGYYLGVYKGRSDAKAWFIEQLENRQEELRLKKLNDLKPLENQQIRPSPIPMPSDGAPLRKR